MATPVVINFDIEGSQRIQTLLIGKYLSSKKQFYDFNNHNTKSLIKDICKNHGENVRLIILDSFTNKFSLNSTNETGLILQFMHVANIVKEANLENVLNIVIMKPEDVIKAFSGEITYNDQNTLNSIFISFSKASINELPTDDVNTYFNYFPFDRKIYNKYVENIIKQTYNGELIYQQIVELEHYKASDSFIKILNFSKPSILPDWYQINKQSTVKNIKKKKFLLMLNNWVLYFRFKNTLLNSTIFDSKFYVNKYQDLSNIKNPVKHFIFYGIEEGRIGGQNYYQFSSDIRKKFDESGSSQSYKYFLLSRI